MLLSEAPQVALGRSLNAPGKVRPLYRVHPHPMMTMWSLSRTDAFPLRSSSTLAQGQADVTQGRARASVKQGWARASVTEVQTRADI